MKSNDQAGTLSAYGRGDVKVRPDVATVYLTVVTEAETAAEATQSNAARMHEVTGAVLGVGIGKDAVHTVGLSLSPMSRFDEDDRQVVIDGYRAHDTIAVRVPVDLAGVVFDTGIAAGANESSGLEYDLDDVQPVRDRALELAVEEARSEARVVARSLGVDLVGAHEVEIEQAGGPIARRMELTTRDAVSTPVMPGEMTVTARVRVTFAFHR